MDVKINTGKDIHVYEEGGGIRNNAIVTNALVNDYIPHGWDYAIRSSLDEFPYTDLELKVMNGYLQIAIRGYLDIRDFISKDMLLFNTVRDRILQIPHLLKDSDLDSLNVIYKDPSSKERTILVCKDLGFFALESLDLIFRKDLDFVAWDRHKFYVDTEWYYTDISTPLSFYASYGLVFK